MTGFAVVSTTVASEADARAIARTLVEARLAACVQILPATSVYRWEGAVEEAAEHLLLCKIAAASFTTVEAAIRARHGYEVPEIVMTEITEGSEPYLAWLKEATAQRASDNRRDGAP